MVCVWAPAVSDGEGGVADEEETAGDTEGVTQGDFTIAASDSIETIFDRLSLPGTHKLPPLTCTRACMRTHTHTLPFTVDCRRTR